MGVARDLIAHGAITTSLAKAKAVQPLMDKLITNAKKQTAAGNRQLLHVLAHEKSVRLLTEWAKTRFAHRQSGYTRIVKLGSRAGDGSEQVIFSFVDPAPATAPEGRGKEKTETGAKPPPAEAEKTVDRTPVGKTKKQKK